MCVTYLAGLRRHVLPLVYPPSGPLGMLGQKTNRRGLDAVTGFHFRDYPKLLFTIACVGMDCLRVNTFYWYANHSSK
jgi:hypothetical protein